MLLEKLFPSSQVIAPAPSDEQIKNLERKISNSLRFQPPIAAALDEAFAPGERELELEEVEERERQIAEYNDMVRRAQENHRAGSTLNEETVNSVRAAALAVAEGRNNGGK